MHRLGMIAQGTVLLATLWLAVAYAQTPSAPGEIKPAANAAAELVPGIKAPAFSLQATDGQTHALDAYLKQDKTVVVEWFNPDCPWVKRYHDDASGNTSLVEAYNYAKAQGAVWLAINSNAAGKQGSGVERNTLARTEYGIDYPVLLDPDGTAGRAYGAKTTPTLYIINPQGVVVSIGGVDDTKTNQDKPTTNYILTALKQYFSGQPVEPSITPHFGCSVKYAE